MQELSMNVLDIAENSTRAGATHIEITLRQDTQRDKQTLVIADDGKGMSAEMVQSVTDPFTTTRTTRKVGLGLPFLKMICEQCAGALRIESEEGVGTTVTARFQLSHIDLAPLGDMGSTLSALCAQAPGTRFTYLFERDGRQFVFDTDEVRQVLGEDVPLSEPAVALWIREYVNEGMQGVLH